MRRMIFWCSRPTAPWPWETNYMLSVRYPEITRRAEQADSKVQSIPVAGAGVRVRAGFSAVLDEKPDFHSSAVLATDTTDRLSSTRSTNPAGQSTDRGGLTAKQVDSKVPSIPVAGAGVRVRAGFSAVGNEKPDFHSSAVQGSDTTDRLSSTRSTNPAGQSADRGGLTAK